jgi:hypothetical protein
MSLVALRSETSGPDERAALRSLFAAEARGAAELAKTSCPRC